MLYNICYFLICVYQQNQPKIERNPHAAYLLWDHWGRFGNNMFEYASSYCIAKQCHLIPTIINSSRLLKVFQNITAEGISVEFQRQILMDIEDRHEKGYAVYSPNIAQIENTSSPVHLSGYLQSYKYFSKCYDDIKQQFTLTDDLQNEVRQTMVRVLLEHLHAQNYISARNKDLFLKNKTVPQEITYIGIHARVNLSYKSGKEYFSNGMAYFRRKYQNVLFLMCTDNSSWVKMNLQNIFLHQDVVLVTDSTSKYEIDFGILVNCNHSLITGNSKQFLLI